MASEGIDKDGEVVCKPEPMKDTAASFDCGNTDIVNLKLLLSDKTIDKKNRPSSQGPAAMQKVKPENTKATIHNPKRGSTQSVMTSSLICDVCGRKFTQQVCYTTHLESHKREMEMQFHNEKLPHVKKRMKLQGKAGAGGLRINVNNKKPYVKVTKMCDICGKLVANLRDHVKRHNNDYRFACDECPRAFICAAKLEQHKCVHTGKKDFLCQDCGKSFMYKKTLQAHVKAHSADRPYPCPFCDKKYLYPSELRRHNQMHHLPKQHQGRNQKNYTNKFPCSTCGMCFTTSTYLRHHEDMHTGKRQHVCELCGAGFSLVQNLVRHRKVLHQGLEIHNCKHCGKVFNNKYNLGRHVMLHEGVRDVRCTVCDKMFMDSVALRRHMRATHKLNTVS